MLIQKMSHGNMLIHESVTIVGGVLLKIHLLERLELITLKKSTL